MKKLLLSLVLSATLFAGYTSPQVGGSVSIPTGNGEWLRLDGVNGPMTGDVNFGNNEITNLANTSYDATGINPWTVGPNPGFPGILFQWVNHSANTTFWRFGVAAANQVNLLEVTGTDGVDIDTIRIGRIPGYAGLDDPFVIESTSDTGTPKPIYMNIKDDANADAVAAPGVYINGSNKTAGTGNGGPIVLNTGSSVGGTAGFVDATNSHINNVSRIELDNGASAVTLTPQLTTGLEIATTNLEIDGGAVASPTLNFASTSGGANVANNGVAKWTFAGSGSFIFTDNTNAGLEIIHQTTTVNPTAGRLKMYPESDDRWKQLTSGGVETALSIDSLVMLLSGANAMTGDLNLGSQDIVNAATVEIDDGVDVVLMSATAAGLDIGTDGLKTTGGDLAVVNSANGVILQSPDTACWRISVDNLGVLSTASVTCP